MKLSRKCEYAFLVLIELAKEYPKNEVIQATVIAEKTGVPRQFLDKILGLLKQNSYVRSVRGVNGGYALSKAPGLINMAEIIRLIDGPIAPVASVSEFFYRHTPSERNRKLTECFKGIRDYTVKKLEGISLDQLI